MMSLGELRQNISKIYNKPLDDTDHKFYYQYEPGKNEPTDNVEGYTGWYICSSFFGYQPRVWVCFKFKD